MAWDGLGEGLVGIMLAGSLAAMTGSACLLTCTGRPAQLDRKFATASFGTSRWYILDSPAPLPQPT